jgi:nucleoside-diphosphate-sugar epimerase
MKEIKSVIITGASGFIGSYLIEMMKEDFIIYAIARRSINETNISYHKNIHWIQSDISNWNILKDTIDYVNSQGGADFIIHLAAYYDFSYKDNSEYDSVNVNGTKNMLEFAKKVGIQRFIFASSIAACNFPKNGEFINEQTPLDANYHYARSKKQGELLLKDYSIHFPCIVIRFAAVFSDWCEFAPLYKFLSRWLSNKFDSRIVGGSGNSAIPYIHIRDICQIICKIINKNPTLPKFDVYICSPSFSTSHNSIFELSTRYFFGKFSKPIYLPKFLALPALFINKIINIFRKSYGDTFEKVWMIEYIDKQLNVDSSYTQNTLNWKPTPRYHITRRLHFLIGKMQNHPDEWILRNEAFLKRIAKRANYLIYEKLIEETDNNLIIIKNIIIIDNPKGKFNQYKQMNVNDFDAYLSAIYHLLLATIRSRDRTFFLEYLDKIAIRKFAEGYFPDTLSDTLKLFSEIISNNLHKFKELSKFKQEINDNVCLTFQIGQDEIEDLYENLVLNISNEFISKTEFPDCSELHRKIKQLSAFYQVAPIEKNSLQHNYFNNLKEF